MSASTGEAKLTLTPDAEREALLIIRTARKDHSCFVARFYERSGSENWIPAEGCTPIIVKGSRYVEYIGEAAAFESGHRYCAACALKHWPNHFANGTSGGPTQ